MIMNDLLELRIRLIVSATSLIESISSPEAGLDIDSMRDVAETINLLRNSKRSFIIITHYHRLLEYIDPDVVHVLVDGKVVLSGGHSLAVELEKTGYIRWLK